MDVNFLKLIFVGKRAAGDVNMMLCAVVYDQNNTMASVADCRTYLKQEPKNLYEIGEFSSGWEVALKSLSGRGCLFWFSRTLPLPPLSSLNFIYIALFFLLLIWIEIPVTYFFIFFSHKDLLYAYRYVVNED